MSASTLPGLAAPAKITRSSYSKTPAPDSQSEVGHNLKKSRLKPRPIVNSKNVKLKLQRDISPAVIFKNKTPYI